MRFGGNLGHFFQVGGLKLDPAVIVQNLQQHMNPAAGASGAFKNGHHVAQWPMRDAHRVARLKAVVRLRLSWGLRT